MYNFFYSLLDPSCIASSQPDALVLRQSYSALFYEINTVWRALSIPVLEPLVPERILKIVKIVKKCLVASVAVAANQSLLGFNVNLSASSLKATTGADKMTTPARSGEPGANLNTCRFGGKEEDPDYHAVAIVEKSLDLYNSILALLRDSTRAGGHILQNFVTMAAWVFVEGLQLQLNHDNKFGGSEKSKMPKDTEEGFGVLSVALGSQLLTSVAALIDDIAAESEEGESQVDVDLSEAPKATEEDMDSGSFMFHSFTATQRVALIFKHAPFIQLLFKLSAVSYRKSCKMIQVLNKSAEKQPDGKKKARAPRGSVSAAVAIEKPAAPDLGAMTVSNLDEFEEYSYPGSDEEEDEDSDSEPLLGKWFVEALFPPEDAAAANGSGTKNDAHDASEHDDDMDRDDAAGLHVPDKGEPSAFISLTSHVFLFLNRSLLGSNSRFVKEYTKSCLKEEHMAILAMIIRDLDHEAGRDDNKKEEYHLASLYSEFSRTLANFTHNMLAHGLLSTEVQNSFLSELRVSPWSDKPWPLQVMPR